MCLEINQEKTLEIRGCYPEEFFAFKYFKSDDFGGWVSPYMRIFYCNGKYFESGRDLVITEEEMEYGISKGIHVYLTKKSAVESGWNYHDSNHLFKVRVKLDDLVAVGQDGDAVFTKIFFDEKDIVNED